MENRMILKSIMVDAGFQNYVNEWWHYTLIEEPYPDTFFDIPIE
jgi:D-alanyl-D-alanine dipeptidase